MRIATTTETHEIPNGSVTLLGAMDRVTGASTLIEAGGQALLVDCGAPIGADADNWVLPREALKADAVFLTHGHTDHISGLTDLLYEDFDKPIYGTKVTLQLTRINARDGIKIQGGSDKDVRAFLTKFNKLAKAVDYDTPLTDVPGVDGRIIYREAGHIMGSASIDFLLPGTRVMCSGDLGRPGSPLLRDYNLVYPEGEPDIDLLVMESTYGKKSHSTDAAHVEDALEKAIKHALRDGGHILIPAFAIGRTQAILYHLNTLVESGRLRDLPVAVDSPLAIKVTDMYKNARELFDEDAKKLLRRGDDPLEFTDLYAVNKGRDSHRLREMEEPMLIIAGSGMCTGGRIVAHLQELLPESNTSLIFVGYQGKGTPGRAIQNAARRGDSVTLRGVDVPVRAEITTISGLSAHADRDELKAWLAAVPTPKRIALNHGEPDAQVALANYIATSS